MELSVNQYHIVYCFYRACRGVMLLTYNFSFLKIMICLYRINMLHSTISLCKFMCSTLAISLLMLAAHYPQKMKFNSSASVSYIANKLDT